MIRWRCKTIVILLLLAGMVSGKSGAAEPVDHFELSPEQLLTATVTSVSKTSEKLMDAPAAVYVLSNEDILRSGATSIAEALRLVPGVQVARTHGGGWAISVRGFNSGLANKLLVLMDGREVYDQLFSGVYWDVQDTVLEDIERIEVIRGPGASLWGANAVNGVINIITKSARATQGGMVSTLAGTQDRAIATGRYGRKTDNDIYYRAYAKYLKREEEEALNGSGARDGQQAYRSGFRADWEDENDAFTVQGDAARNDDSQYRISSLNVLRIEQIRATGWNLLGRWKRELPEQARLTVQAYVDYAFRDQLLLADQRTSFDLDAHYELPVTGRHKIIIGGRYRLSQDELTPSSAVVVTHRTRNDQLLSGFVQDKITLVPEAWFLTLGSKFEHNDYSGVEMQPNARLQWHIDPNQMAWASVARAVRTPSQLEHDLRINYLLGILGLVPNPRFDSEALIAYELGYRQQITPELVLDAAAFYNDYDKLAATSVLPGGFFPITFIIGNGSQAENYGGELVVNWRYSNALNFSGSYSLLKINLHGPSNGVDAEVAEGQSPQQQFNLRSQWNIRDDLFWDTTLYYVDTLPNFRINDHWRLDLGLGWNISEGLQLNLVAQDILAEAHREFGSRTDPFTPPAKIEPNIYGKLTWRF